MPPSMPPSGEKQSHTFTQFYREPERKTIHLVSNATNRAADFCLDQGTLSPIPPACHRVPWALCHYRSPAARLARDGSTQPIDIKEADRNFAIGCEGDCRIEGATVYIVGQSFPPPPAPPRFSIPTVERWPVRH
jgi:hypothetical protein